MVTLLEVFARLWSDSTSTIIFLGSQPWDLSLHFSTNNLPGNIRKELKNFQLNNWAWSSVKIKTSSKISTHERALHRIKNWNCIWSTNFFHSWYLFVKTVLAYFEKYNCLSKSMIQLQLQKHSLLSYSYHYNGASYRCFNNAFHKVLRQSKSG